MLTLVHVFINMIKITNLSIHINYEYYIKNSIKQYSTQY